MILFYLILENIIKIIFILITVAFFTLAERQLMAIIQRRKGPNIIGFLGTLQSLVDGAKLFLKELIIPIRVDKKLYTFAPMWIFIWSFTGWILTPMKNKKEKIKTIESIKNNIEFFIFDFSESFANKLQISIAETNFSLLIILAISSLNIYGIIVAGWASNSKYAFLGAIRSTAQMISYEIILGLSLVPILLITLSFNLNNIIDQQILTKKIIRLLPHFFIIFIITMLAETNRTPFDLPEAEAELVAGYNVEYSSMLFAFFFLGEYSNMLFMAVLANIIYIVGLIKNQFLLFEVTKILFFTFLFIIIRATLPRYRYDQLMYICWKCLLPVVLTNIAIITPIIFKQRNNT